ncbi:MAG: D-alanyl-D-alanine carboxypeptidase/D-alanyl-D-alanine-endopeptidase [Acidimicrobiales bacterium]|nr:D-alanyl-D-alanine carboxypeptidase/D-alanyl-D-alanine-endopeptidase [Acidimicrobiales bacterium]MCB1015819.1 D-alanyl-D-alanine carboxypeptidase/D-alanyl-D-alanine-endopeptidase [Acidimicrobiales bacterium]
MRRLVLPLLLVVVAVGAGAAALVVDARAAEAPAAAEQAAPVTPLLSARRVPDLASRAGADARLRTGLESLAGVLPAQSCLVVEADGRTLVTHRPEDAVTPASTEKVLTAAAALAALGPDHRYRTRVQAAAEPTDGVVDGPLYLVGGGDPVLATEAYALRSPQQDRAHTSLEELADRVAAAGVRRVGGGVVGDESRYGAERYVADWPSRYIDQNQTGPLSALSVNDGFDSFPSADDPGAPLRPSADPAAHAAALFTLLLRERGVEVAGGPSTGTAPGDAVTVARVRSKPLPRILAQLLTFSDNQTAELVLREVGRVDAGDGSTAGGAAAVEQLLAEDGLAVGPEDAVDGSGLAESNRLTCATLVATIDAYPELVDGFATGGEEGTLASFAGTPLEGRLHAKTGSLNHVRALAGVVDLLEGGERLTFAYVVNNPPFITPEQDALRGQLGALLASYPDRPPLVDLVPVPVPGQADDEGGAPGATPTTVPTGTTDGGEG